MQKLAYVHLTFASVCILECLCCSDEQSLPWISGDRAYLVERLITIPISQETMTEELRTRALFYRHAQQIMTHLQGMLENIRYCDMRTSLPRRVAAWLVAIQQAYFQTLLLDAVHTDSNNCQKLDKSRQDLVSFFQCLNVWLKFLVPIGLCSIEAFISVGVMLMGGMNWSIAVLSF